jgi:hypothetical protein
MDAPAVSGTGTWLKCKLHIKLLLQGLSNDI